MRKFFYSRLGCAGMACLLASSAVMAQESDFDLSAQRSEVQHIEAVPGHKVDHHGWFVNPTPHVFEVAEGSLDLSRGVTVKDRQGKFANDLSFLKATHKGGKRLTIDFGAKVAAKHGVKAVSGAYRLVVDGRGIGLVGYDERGAYYGLHTLRQLLESPAAGNGHLPFLTVNDWPDLPNRGVVEGFYGTPWSHQVRLSLIDFYGEFKLNAYLYGPKDDPYHSSPNWRQPYPEKEAKNIRELIEACNRNRVDFVWAIHPGKDIRWNEEDYQNLVHKFDLMYALGVRHFAVFFDDISGEGTNPEKQVELLNRLTDDFVKAKGDVSPLTVCPTDYSKIWANPAPDGPLSIYGRKLYPEIKVFWTGDVVCSDLTKSTTEWVNSRIQRPDYFWWNYPVTDYARNFLLQGPVYGLDTSLTSQDVCGIVSNPMEHGEASKLALYGLADYTWNLSAYNAIDSWERSLARLMPKAAEAYRTFAIHSCDTETGYRRDESWETKTFRLADWNEASARPLEAEYAKMEAAPAQIEAGCDNAALLGEIKPWLQELGKLGIRGRGAVELGRLFVAGQSDSVCWSKYVANLMTREDRKSYEAHKVGTLKMQPFYDNLMDDIGHLLLTRMAGQEAADYKGVSSFGNSGTIQTKLMFDNDSTTYYTSGMSQRNGSWIGVDLRDVRDVTEVNILQGRNSTDDVDYLDHAVLECSADGRNWHTLIAELDKQYVISWKGEAVKARYVRLRRLDSKKTNYASVRTFEVNPLRACCLGIGLEADRADEAVRAFDLNPGTFYTCKGQVSFDVTDGTKSCIILSGAAGTPFNCRQLDAKGRLVAQCEVSSPYARVSIAGKKVKRLVIEGNVNLYEIIRLK